MTQPDWYNHGLPHIWLPYAQMKTALPPLPVVGAKGCRIKLADGRELVDGIASWWSMCHGYQHPAIVDAIQKQVSQLSHVMFGGLAHESAYELAHALSSFAPQGLGKVFFADSGSIAVEVALKIALQYWHNLGKPKKNKLICFENAYHGDTFGAMSVSTRNGMHQAFDSLSGNKHYCLEIPNDEYSFAEFEETVAAIAPSVAGLIIEPMVQGAGGMLFHSPDVLAEIRRVCREHDILFIADEIMTGFYRTGTRFACDEAGIAPDIMCVGKALTGGHIALAATLTTDAVFEGFYDDDPAKALMHGPTFMANPIACAAALASVKLFAADDYGAKVERIEQQLRKALAPCNSMDGVADVRVRGAIGVVQIEAPHADMYALRARAVELDVWLRPFEGLVYCMPPLTISEQELSTVADAMVQLVRDWSQKRQS